MTIQADSVRDKANLNVIHIRLPYTEKKANWLRGDNGVCYLVQILAQPMIAAEESPSDIFESIANQGGYTIGWTLADGKVLCSVADAEDKNFSRDKGRSVAYDILNGLEKPQILKRYSFEFDIPKDWNVTERDGIQFVLEADHPFMDLLRDNFLQWLSFTSPHPGTPGIFWLNSKPCLFYTEPYIDEEEEEEGDWS